MTYSMNMVRGIASYQEGSAAMIETKICFFRFKKNFSRRRELPLRTQSFFFPKIDKPFELSFVAPRTRNNNYKKSDKGFTYGYIARLTNLFIFRQDWSQHYQQFLQSCIILRFFLSIFLSLLFVFIFLQKYGGRGEKCIHTTPPTHIYEYIYRAEWAHFSWSTSHRCMASLQVTSFAVEVDFHAHIFFVIIIVIIITVIQGGRRCSH